MSLFEVLGEIAQASQNVGRSFDIGDLIRLREYKRQQRLMEEPYTFEAITGPETLTQAGGFGKIGEREATAADIQAIINPERKKQGLPEIPQTDIGFRTRPTILPAKTVPLRQADLEARQRGQQLAMIKELLRGQDPTEVIKRSMAKLSSNILSKIEAGTATEQDLRTFSLLQGHPLLKEGRESSQFSTIDPRYYTPESIRKFQETGDYSVLVPTQTGTSDPYRMDRLILSMESSARQLAAQETNRKFPKSGMSFNPQTGEVIFGGGGDPTAAEYFSRRFNEIMRSKIKGAKHPDLQPYLEYYPEPPKAGEAGVAIPGEPYNPGGQSLMESLQGTEGQIEQTKILNGKTYVKIKGKWFEK
jgi:hypothetical protein